MRAGSTHKKNSFWCQLETVFLTGPGRISHCLTVTKLSNNRIGKYLRKERGGRDGKQALWAFLIYSLFMSKLDRMNKVGFAFPWCFPKDLRLNLYLPTLATY